MGNVRSVRVEFTTEFKVEAAKGTELAPLSGAERFALIASECANFTINRMARLLKVSRGRVLPVESHQRVVTSGHQRGRIPCARLGP